MRIFSPENIQRDMSPHNGVLWMNALLFHTSKLSDVVERQSGLESRFPLLMQFKRDRTPGFIIKLSLFERFISTTRSFVGSLRLFWPNSILFPSQTAVLSLDSMKIRYSKLLWKFCYFRTALSTSITSGRLVDHSFCTSIGRVALLHTKLEQAHFFREKFVGWSRPGLPSCQ